jgi:hypothetical protein
MTRRVMMLAWGAAVIAWGADLPSADSLLERYVEATGGRKAYDARKSEIMRGTVEYSALGVKGTVVRWEAQGLYRMHMEFPGIGAMEAGVKGGIAWERSDLLGPRVKEGVERAEALREAEMSAEAKWRDLYRKVETTGEETVDGEECYKVTLTPDEGAPETMFLSKKSGLALKMMGTATTQLGEVTLEVFFKSYKNFGGILEPVQVIEKTAGQQITFTVDQIEANPAIPASQFDLPAEVAALVEAAKQAK